MPDVRAACVDAPLLGVERKRVEAPAVLDPERLVEAGTKLCRLLLEPFRERAVAPDLARELGEPELRRVHVALHLDGRDRRLGRAPVVEALRVARVLPRLVHEAVPGAPEVLDEAVAVPVAVLVDPGEPPQRGLVQPGRERRVVRPAPGL